MLQYLEGILFYFKWNCLCFKNAMYFAGFCLQPATSCKKYCVLSGGMRFCMFTRKETTNTTSLKWIVIFPRKVTCFNCFSGMLTIETKCIFCLLSNAAPFEWECLFDKHAPVNQFFLEEKNALSIILKKNSVLIGFFRLEESTQRWNFLMGVKSIQLTEGTIEMDAFPEECVQNAVFPDLRSKICPGVLGES